MNIRIISALLVLSVVAVFFFTTEKGLAAAFPSGRDQNPFLRFICPFVLGGVVIAAEAMIFLIRGPRDYHRMAITGVLAMVNGLTWGILNMWRSERPSLRKGMIVSWVVTTGILAARFFPMMLLILAMIALKTLFLWPFLFLLLIISAVLNKWGKLSGMLSLILDAPKEKIEHFLTRHKTRIYSLSAILLMIPFVIITIFYVMMYMGWGPHTLP